MKLRNLVGEFSARFLGLLRVHSAVAYTVWKGSLLAVKGSLGRLLLRKALVHWEKGRLGRGPLARAQMVMDQIADLPMHLLSYRQYLERSFASWCQQVAAFETVPELDVQQAPLAVTRATRYLRVPLWLG